MTHRFKLFNKTYESVIRQTNIDFKWIVLWDAATTRIIERPRMVNLLVVDWLSELQQYLKKDHPEGWIITSRLDNDDHIDPTFMATVQAAATEEEAFLNIPNGRWGAKPIYHAANQFVSYVEQTRRSVYFTPHGSAMQKHAPLKQITEKRLWTTVLHERNYING